MSKARDSRELLSALKECRTAFFGVAVISGLVNILYLTGSFFMLEVYDRVIPSRSVPTLIGLLVLALALYAFQGVIEVLRSRILSRVGTSLDEALSGRVFSLIVRGPLHGQQPTDGLTPLRDLDAVRSFLAGSGPSALFDLPWIPIYIAICALFHPYIGIAAVMGLCVLVVLTLATDWATGKRVKQIIEHSMLRNGLAEASRRNAEMLTAMGMRSRFGLRWGNANRAYIEAQERASDLHSGFGSISKIFRMALQSAVLALGAWLVINNLATGGIIIASSILVSRALAPAELAIANWKGFVQARQAWGRLALLLGSIGPEKRQLGLPAPQRTLSVEGVSIAPPGVPRFVVQDLSLTLQAGQGLGLIGPSASGKSSLARAIVGVWPALRGKVRLDGAALDQWSSDDLGPHVGFLPQEVELFAGTVAENISRFDPAATSEQVIGAARAAGVHDLILRLPEGYETKIGEIGHGLSGGQRQRVGLARALYGDPFLVVLDEPNANLDHEGENALTQAIIGVRQRGGICIVVAHRPSALAALDMVMLMADGRAQAFGPKDEVLRKVIRPAPAVQPDGEALPRPAQGDREQPGALTLQESA